MTNLGKVYTSLAGIRDQKENCKFALAAYEDAMDALSYSDNPDFHSEVLMDYENVLRIYVGYKG